MSNYTKAFTKFVKGILPGCAIHTGAGSPGIDPFSDMAVDLYITHATPSTKYRFWLRVGDNELCLRSSCNNPWESQPGNQPQYCAVDLGNPKSLSIIGDTLKKWADV